MYIVQYIVYFNFKRYTKIEYNLYYKRENDRLISPFQKGHKQRLKQVIESR